MSANETPLAVQAVDFGTTDGMALLGALRARLGLEITAEEAAEIRTVTDLHGLLVVKSLLERDPAGPCGTELTFYRLRRALRGMGAGKDIRLTTPLTQLQISSPRQALRELNKRTGLAQPMLALAPFDKWILLTTGVAVTVCLGFAVAGRDYFIETLLTAGLTVALVIQQWWAPRRYPKDLVTVGDLTRQVARLNADRQLPAVARSDSSTLWSILVEVLLDISHQRSPDVTPAGQRPG